MENLGTSNYSNRESWVKKIIGAIPPGETILDAGAGPMNYKPLCGNLKYKSQDLGNIYGNRAIDIVSDITAIPVPDESFDNILCTEVLEHLPDPMMALQELTRILKPGGRLILTAPFACFKHEEPYFYNTGFDKRWYEYHIPKLGYNIACIEENGNYYEFMAQELRRIADYNPEQKDPVEAALAAIAQCKNIELEKMSNFGVHVMAQKNSDLKICYIESGMFVFDVGANKGDKTKQYLDTGCRILCVEPNPILFEKLKERFGAQFLIENVALGAEAGSLPLYICRASNGEPIYEISSMSSDFKEQTHKYRFSCFSYKDDDFITVPVTTLDVLIEKYGLPDYVKIDVEGFEMEVLRGLSYPVRFVSIEFTPELCEKSVECINRFLQISPAYRFNYTSRETNRLSFEKEIEAGQMIEWLRKIEDKMVEYGDIYAVLG